MGNLFQAFAYLYQKRQVLIRLILVWLLGLLIFNYDEKDGFDTRFKLRSKQPIDQNIVLINIDKKTWDRVLNPSFPQMLQSARPLSDSYFWSTSIWKSLLARLLKDQPASVVVDLFFDNSIPMSSRLENSFKVPNVIWRAETNERRTFKKPRFAIQYFEAFGRSERSLLNVGLGYIYKDYDNIARKYNKASRMSFLKDIPDKASESFREQASSYIPPTLKPFINFRGPSGSYTTLSLDTVLSGYYPRSFFKNKIVIIGSNSMESHFVKTPVGILTRSEYNANVIDNILNDRWIKALAPHFYVVYLLGVVLICFFVLHLFRQGLAISCLVLLSVSLTALSIILFDIYSIWLPIQSPLACIIISYVILLNHLLSESELQTWAVQKKEESTREMNELKNNFVSLFSHDLKTPLAKIHAISDKVLQTKSLGCESVNSEILKIKNETQELDRYIQSILQVTRIEAGEFNLNIVPQDINELVKNCISLFSPLTSAKNISISFNEEPLFPVDMDAHLIKEVFINIIDNSIKYCPKNSLINIQTLDDEEFVKIIFSDNGPGIQKEEQGAIFEKFYRSKTDQLNKKGTGLGLYLVRYFIEIHHGKVELESQPGVGTKFTIKLPYEQKKTNEENNV